MKRNNLIKIALLAMTAVLLIGAAFGISAMAEGEGETPSVEILYKNLEYNDKISILYAVKATGTEAPVLKIYDESGSCYTVLSHAAEEINGETCYIFKSRGLKPTEMTKVLYAQAVIEGAGVESAMTSYSITEYCYKRLYKDVNVTEDQKNLYNSVIRYGTAVQNVENLNNGTEIPTPSDYYYVNIEGAAPFSKEVNNENHSFNAGIFTLDSKFNLPEYNGEDKDYFDRWAVKCDGKNAKDYFNENTELTISNHTVIQPNLDTAKDVRDAARAEGFAAAESSIIPSIEERIKDAKKEEIKAAKKEELTAAGTAAEEAEKEAEEYAATQIATDGVKAEIEASVARVMEVAATTNVSSIITNLQTLYTLYTPDVYEWLASLYSVNDGKGGFYFSTSAKNDTSGKYLPDIESTFQVLYHLNLSGMLSDLDNSYQYAISKDMRNQLVKFVKSLQAADGYFYHPQWTVNGIPNGAVHNIEGDPSADEIYMNNFWISRRGRDLGHGKNLLKALGVASNYDYPGTNTETVSPASALTTRLSASRVMAVSKVVATSSTLPSYLQSQDAWKAYIEGLNLHRNPYEIGNTLAAMHHDISAAENKEAGYVKILTDYLTAEQNPETGFWDYNDETVDKVGYDTLNGFMKLSYSFTYYDVAIPNRDKALESSMSVLLEEHKGHKNDPNCKDLHVCCTFNAWENFVYILESAEEGEERETLRAQLLANAPDLIRRTYENISYHLTWEGCFTYQETWSATTSQKAPTAPTVYDENGKEILYGDVNATTISVTGIAADIAKVLGVDMVPIYVPEDAERFFGFIEERYPVDEAAHRGTGKYYNDTATDYNNPVRWDMTATNLWENRSEWYNTENPITSSNLSIIEEYGNKFIRGERLNTNANNITFGYRNTNTEYVKATTLDANHVAVFEFDVRFDATSLTNPNNTQVWKLNLFTGGANGRYGQMALAITPFGKVRVLNMGSPFMLDQNVWYNLRFELDMDGNCAVYVDNELTSTVTLTYNRVEAHDRMEMNFNSNVTSVNWKIDLDNVFLGSYVEAE